MKSLLALTTYIAVATAMGMAWIQPNEDRNFYSISTAVMFGLISTAALAMNIGCVYGVYLRWKTGGNRDAL